MNCETCRAELFAFHLGESRGEQRDAVEAHLRTCAACVREFLEVKRALELTDDAPAPSVRVKMRAAVEAEFAPKSAWWERPLAGLVGVASVVVAVLLVAP
ncbi:MAG: zf-HC2 domain-containing protein [Myxococcaceae bacterium]